VKRSRLGRHLPIVSIVVNLRPTVSDDLLGRAQQGEAEAFNVLVDAYHAELMRVAYVIYGDVEVARDAVQAAWIKAWRQLPGLREPGRFRSWLVAIAANEARQAIRARHRRALREVIFPEVEPAAAGPTVDHTDLAIDRQLLAMRYLAGLGSDEIARATGRSASGVRVATPDSCLDSAWSSPMSGVDPVPWTPESWGIEPRRRESTCHEGQHHTHLSSGPRPCA
jgi:DNA-directed RNA polymerase specialized sigma24 family protein